MLPLTNELTDLRALVFDLDATLYEDPRLGEAVNVEAHAYIAEMCGIDQQMAVELLQRTKDRLTLERGITGTLSLAIGELGLDLPALHRRFAERIEPAPFLPRDERVVTLLRELAGHYALVLYTNNNRTLSAKIMQSLGVAELFSRVFTIEDTWRPKPDRGTLEMIFTAIDRRPDQCLFIGDRYDVDLRLPREMGAQVYLVAGLAELLRLPTVLASRK